MAAVKSNSLHTFKKRYLEGLGDRHLSKYTFSVVAISNIFLSDLDLDRHSHLPFSKIVALNINVAISCELYHRDPIYLYNEYPPFY